MKSSPCERVVFLNFIISFNQEIHYARKVLLQIFILRTVTRQSRQCLDFIFLQIYPLHILSARVIAAHDLNEH